MAVYEHSYKPYEGELTSARTRFLVLPRYAYQDLFKYKLFTALFVASYVAPLIFGILIYLHHNSSALAIFNINAADVVPINGIFFFVLANIQTTMAFIFTVIIGPVLISRDLANNALPLYLSRPFTRVEYVIGKMSVLMILLSLIIWVPGMLLFIFQSYLEGGSWLAENWWIAKAIMVGGMVWIMALTLLVLALSAWIKWRTAASAALFATFIIPAPIGFAIQGIFNTTAGHLLNISIALEAIMRSLFRYGSDDNKLLTTSQGWMVFAVYCGICLFMLSRRVRAYEVIS